MQQENKMGVMPVNRLIISMSLPMIVSMLVMALYNVVDSIFVSWIGEKALTAVSLSFPIQNLMIAIATGTGVGINALLAMNLGRKDFKAVGMIASNGIFLAACSSLLFIVFGLFFTPLYFQSQTADPEIIRYGSDYLRVCSIFCFGLFMQITNDRVLQATGKTIYTMFTQGTGAIINIILDPILIFGYLGLPALGVAGAAWATVIGQLAGMLLSVFFNVTRNHEVRLEVRGFRPHLQTIKSIYAIGVPSIIMASIISVMNFFMNRILLGFTDTANAVLGVYIKLMGFVFMPVFGLNNGMIPIISYNYGARNRLRIRKTIILCSVYATSIMLVGFILFQLFPHVLLSLFKASPQMMEIGLPAFKIISFSFLMAGYSIVCGSVFQALGRGVLSMNVSLTRQLVVLLPLAWILSRTGNLNLVWLSFPLADVVAVVLCTVLLRRTYRKEIQPLPEGNPV